jgi:hypothetical protein
MSEGSTIGIRNSCCSGVSASIAKETVATLRRHWTDVGIVLLVRHWDQAAVGMIAEAERCGAVVSAIIAGTRPADAPLARCPLRAADESQDLGKLAFDRWLANPPAEMQAWLDGLDPQRRCVVFGPPGADMPEFCGRVVVGWRSPETALIEDKTVIDDVWSRIGVPSPAHAVVAADDLRLWDHITRIDRGHGVVLAIDSTQGHIGDAHGLAWIRTQDDLRAARTRFDGRTARLRIAEFVAGVPCSILGMVLDDGIAVFDPIEIVTLRDRQRGLIFCGSSTWWRPSEPDRVLMRQHTRGAGEYLARHLAYRGIYSVDGILSPRGFVATELNPRHASGLGLRKAIPDFPLYLFNRSVQSAVSGMAAFGAQRIETEFRNAVLREPSLSIRIPWAAGASPRDGSATEFERVVSGCNNETYAVRGAHVGRATVVRDIVPTPPGGIVAAVAAVLARSLRVGDYHGFEEEVAGR